MDRYGDEWRRKGATLSDKTVRSEYGLTQDEIYDALDAGKLPGGRGFGDPVKLMVDFDEGADVVTAVPYRPGSKLLVVATDGRGFVAPADEIVSSTRKGRQFLNTRPPSRAALLVPADGDHVAAIGENRKLVIFPIRQVAEMGRGSGEHWIFSIDPYEARAGVDSTSRSRSPGRSARSEWRCSLAEGGAFPSGTIWSSGRS